MIPSVGRIVHYTISDNQATAINKRRVDAQVSKIASTESGVVVHVGNPVMGGEVYPMLITRLWTDSPVSSSPVQGQVFLDGNDNLWVTSAQQGTGQNNWFDPRENVSKD